MMQNILASPATLMVKSQLNPPVKGKTQNKH